MTDDPPPVDAIRSHLRDELAHEGAADALSEAFADWLLPWSPPATLDPARAARTVAFAFGWNRRPNGNLDYDDDPVNGAIADVVVRLHGEFPNLRHCHCQHEVAHHVEHRVPWPVDTVNPALTPRGEIEYLSTLGIWRKLVDDAGGPESLGPVLVVGHRLHVPRILLVGRHLGVDCHAPPVDLPADFDDRPSNQPWCRTAERYVLHDAISRLVFHRNHRHDFDAPSTHDR